MKEIWKIQKSGRNPRLYHIVSNRSNWFIAEEITYNNAMTIITHFNNLGRVKLDENGDVK